jgi:hypothetical protein
MKQPSKRQKSDAMDRAYWAGLLAKELPFDVTFAKKGEPVSRWRVIPGVGNPPKWVYAPKEPINSDHRALLVK